jgi:hypothetical protein
VTTQLPVLTKQELVDALRSSRDELAEKVRAMPAEGLEAGRYESGWNAREILAHVASIEWTYPRLIDIARGGDAPKREEPAAQPREEAKADVPTRTARGGILSYNDRQVEKRAGASVAELLDEFAKNRAATIEAVEAADEALFSKEIRSAGGITGPLSGVINAVAVLHVRGHLHDILGKS